MNTVFPLLMVLVWGVLGSVLGVKKGQMFKKSSRPSAKEERKPSAPTERRRVSETVKLEYPDRGLFGDLRDE